MITMPQYRRACYLVDRHDAAEAFARFVYPNPQGRPAALKPRTYLVGCLLTIATRRTMLAKEVFEVLTRDLPPEAMVELDVAVRERRPDGRTVARVTLTIHHVYNFTRRVRTRSGGGTGQPIDPKVKDELLGVVHRILDTTLPTRPDGSGAYAIDESGTWAWSRGYKARDDEQHDNAEADPDQRTPSARSADPDARWGGKTAKNGGEETFFGYSLHGLIRAPAKRAGYESEPFLAERLDLTPASTDVVDVTLGMIDAITASGRRVDEVIADRHYSYKAADRWVYELLDRGITQVADLRKDQQGFTDAAGTRVAAGWPHCPATPDHLGEIHRPGPAIKEPKAVADAVTRRDQAAAQRRRAAFEDAIGERRSYALARIGRSPGDPKNRRYECPALDGKVGCPRRPGSVETALARGLPVVEQPPPDNEAPKVCTASGGTVTLKLQDLQPKVHQELYWGSPEWEQSYGRRTYVESFFGVLKDAATTNLKRDAYRGDGLGLRLIHVGLCVALTNLRLVRKWHETTGNRLDVDDVLLADDEHPTEFLLDEAG